MDENNSSPLNLNITINPDKIDHYIKVTRPPTPIPDDNDFLMDFILPMEGNKTFRENKMLLSIEVIEEMIKHKIDSLKENIYLGKPESDNIPQAPPLMYSPNTQYENLAVDELMNMENPYGKYVHFYGKKEMDYYMYHSFNNGIWIIVTKKGEPFTTYQKWIN